MGGCPWLSRTALMPNGMQDASAGGAGYLGRKATAATRSATLPRSPSAETGRERSGYRGQGGWYGQRPVVPLEWLDGCGLVKPLDEGELAYSSGVLVEQVAELLRDLAVNAHTMVEGVVPEPRVPHRNDMLTVFDEPLFAEIGLVDLAVGFVLVEEPVVTNGLGVLLLGQPEDLGCLGLELLQLAWADLHPSDDRQMIRDASLNRSRRFKALGKREDCRRSHARGDQVDEVLRHFAVDARVMVEGVVPEQDRGRRHGVHLVLDQSLFTGKQLVDLARCSVLVDEPVAPKRVRVLLSS